MKAKRIVSAVTAAAMLMPVLASAAYAEDNTELMAAKEPYVCDFSALVKDNTKTEYGTADDVIQLDDYTTAYLTYEGTYVDEDASIHTNINGTGNKYGNYNLNDTKLIAFCATNHIALKNKRSKLPYLFWFSTHQDKRTKINDKAHHLMRHIRNAFAHGLIKKEGKNFTFQDYSTIGTQTMGGHIRCDLFWAMLDLLKHTKL